MNLHVRLLVGWSVCQSVAFHIMSSRKIIKKPKNKRCQNFVIFQTIWNILENKMISMDLTKSKNVDFFVNLLSDIRQDIQYHNYLIYAYTGCSLNIVFFSKFLKYCGLLPFFVVPQFQCVYTHQAGRTPALQQKWQSSENHTF